MISRVLLDIEEAIVNKDESSFEQACDRLDEFLLETDIPPQSFIDRLLNLIDTEGFIGMPKSWLLLRVINYNSENLSEQQRSLFTKKLRDLFYEFSDKTTCLLIMEIIPEIHPSEEGFRLIMHLDKKTGHPSRMFLAHGFKSIVEHSKDGTVVDKAYVALERLTNDRDVDVSNFASKELEVIKKNQ